ncbi:uncharacterized protein EV422DRAFT_520840 [Fimicolochytrium jonesii]|uniref:uncharacterized protein n=1 Tax=Fimicolochytrium jonesii TaxID=1396493 RepID=UPI0022FEDF73|nr:uncharacterized protein EV422DRAFT_520840 [Fimicolochytrium jonesii]KAI8823381.1 hypothetical protein EV422DRAFT_520840 [Fimicolochytrium jonesii]
MAQSKTNQEVLQFLQDLDNIVPTDDPALPTAGDLATTTGTAATTDTHSSQDVLSFLNELDAPVEPAPLPKVVKEGTGSPAVMTTVPGVGGVTVPGRVQTPTTAASVGSGSIGRSAGGSRNATPGLEGKGQGQGFGSAQGGNERPAQSETSPQSDSWGALAGGWSSIWSQAAKVGATATTSLTKGLESAKAIAEETAKSVAANENVKGIINREQMAKLGTNLSHLTHTLVDTIAPPIPDSESTASSPLAPVVSLYFSAPADPDVGDLRDFILATLREMWIGRVCDRVALEGVEGGRVCTGLGEAVGQVKETMAHLHQLSATSATPPSPHHAHVFLAIQPFAPALPTKQIQYYVTMSSPQAIGAESSPSSSPSPSTTEASAISQSVADEATGSTDGGGLTRKWGRHQKRRIVETVVADVCEEFGVRCVDAQDAAPTVGKTDGGAVTPGDGVGDGSGEKVV